MVINCVVCRYWSERLEEARKYRHSKGVPDEEKRVIAILQMHQGGACACRFPDLLKDLAKHEVQVPDKTPGVHDPLRVRILAA
jgi:hypothetical protein